MQRRSTIYHTEGRQLSLAELEALKRFSYGAYAFSVVGLLKIVAALVFFAAGVVFLAAPTCDDAPGWFSAVPPALHLTVGVLLVAMYALFTLGFPDDNLSAWVKADEILLLLEAATAVAGSILTLVSCDNKDPLHFVPAIAGLAGALLLVVDCAALFVMWRSRFDVEEAAWRGPSVGGAVGGGMPGDRPPPRKSIFA